MTDAQIPYLLSFDQLMEVLKNLWEQTRHKTTPIKQFHKQLNSWQAIVIVPINLNFKQLHNDSHVSLSAWAARGNTRETSIVNWVVATVLMFCNLLIVNSILSFVQFCFPLDRFFSQSHLLTDKADRRVCGWKLFFIHQAV